MAQRIKGQEVSLGFTGPNGSVNVGEAVQSFEAELDIQTLEEGYLGEVANRYDDIFNGVSGTVKVHMESSDWFRFTQAVQDRAQRRTAAGGKFSATATFAFPSGQRFRLTFEDIFFGALPVSSGGRAEYVTATVAWKCSSIRRVF